MSKVYLKAMSEIHKNITKQLEEAHLPRDKKKVLNTINKIVMHNKKKAKPLVKKYLCAPDCGKYYKILSPIIHYLSDPKLILERMIREEEEGGDEDEYEDEDEDEYEEDEYVEEYEDDIYSY